MKVGQMIKTSLFGIIIFTHISQNMVALFAADSSFVLEDGAVRPSET
jgi:hypothetical protein